MMPHRICLLPDAWLVPWMAASDLLIAAAYIAIPAVLVVYARASGASVPRGYRTLVHGFVVFITLCGATHVLDAVTLWWPIYRIEAVVSAACALSSIVVAIALARAAPGWTLSHWRDAMEMLDRAEARRREHR